MHLQLCRLWVLPTTVGVLLGMDNQYLLNPKIEKVIMIRQLDI